VVSLSPWLVISRNHRQRDCPALIETEMTKSEPKARADLIPVGRMGTVEETAEVVVMLARTATSPARPSTSTAAGT